MAISAFVIEYWNIGDSISSVRSVFGTLEAAKAYVDQEIINDAVPWADTDYELIPFQDWREYTCSPSDCDWLSYWTREQVTGDDTAFVWDITEWEVKS